MMARGQSFQFETNLALFTDEVCQMFAQIIAAGKSQRLIKSFRLDSFSS